MKMSDRKKKVLQAIVHDYIQTAEPVGSRTISKNYNLQVSPATIRNEMSDLEEMGYIEQPHTSSGRIPSNRGYRYYVDCLMEHTDLTEAEEALIKREISKKMKQIDGVIQSTSKLLSSFTQYTSLINSPQISSKVIQHVQLIPYQHLQALLIIVTDTGAVMHRPVPIPEEVTPEDLSAISQLLNNKLMGKSVEKMRHSMFNEIYSQLMQQSRLVKGIFELVEQAMEEEQEHKHKIYLGGTLNILNQPEFKDVEKIKQILGILDEEEVVKNILAVNDPNSGVNIRIGKENAIAGIDVCSVITATYTVGGDVVGTIGILGPTRMNYSKAIAVVEVMSKTLSKVLGSVDR